MARRGMVPLELLKESLETAKKDNGWSVGPSTRGWASTQRGSGLCPDPAIHPPAAIVGRSGVRRAATGRGFHHRLTRHCPVATGHRPACRRQDEAHPPARQRGRRLSGRRRGPHARWPLGRVRGVIPVLPVQPTESASHPSGRGKLRQSRRLLRTSLPRPPHPTRRAIASPGGRCVSWGNSRPRHFRRDRHDLPIVRAVRGGGIHHGLCRHAANGSRASGAAGRRPTCRFSRRRWWFRRPSRRPPATWA